MLKFHTVNNCHLVKRSEELVLFAFSDIELKPILIVESESIFYKIHFYFQ